MLLIFGGRSSIGTSLMAIAEGRKEPYLSIGRTKYGANWLEGDLFDPSTIVNHLELSSNSKISRIIFCHRYRPSKIQSYSIEQEFRLMISGPLKVSRMAFQNFSRLNNITFISSPASQYVSDEQPIGYHITRSSLESMVRYLAIEFSSKDIAVNAVRLGYVKSPSCKENRDLGFYSCDAVAVPRGFAPTPMEVANAIDQLSKIKTGILTGQTISLDAGLTLRSHASLTERTRTFFTSSQ